MNIEEQRQKTADEFKENMDYDELMNCIRCGFCLPSCPTYLETEQDEAASPRGRIALMKGVVDGKIEPDEEVEKQLNMCLGCRACEPVCPSGVKYGHLLEEARDIINRNKKHSLPVKAIRHLAFKQLFPHKKRIRTVNGLLWLYQSSGVQKAARKLKVMNLLPKHFSSMEKALPNVPSPARMKKRPVSVSPSGELKKRVAFFSGCLMDTMFMETNDNTLFLLKKAGCEVVIPETQTCCGALHAHSGEKEQAKELAKKNIEAFETAEADYIISNAGGCGAILAEYDQLLKGDPDWEERAQQFTAKIKDISSVLMEVGLPEMELSPVTVTYQDSCHLRNVLHTSQQPRKLIQSIAGVRYKEMKEADRCCGSAGIYNLVQPEMSTQILDGKMEKIKDTEATIIATANPGCLLQMKLGIEREGLQDRVEALHIVDVLANAVRTAELNKQDTAGGEPVH